MVKKKVVSLHSVSHYNMHLIEQMGKVLEHFQHIGRFFKCKKPVGDLFIPESQNLRKYVTNLLSPALHDAFCKEFSVPLLSARRWYGHMGQANIVMRSLDNYDQERTH